MRNAGLRIAEWVNGGFCVRPLAEPRKCRKNVIAHGVNGPLYGRPGKMAERPSEFPNDLYGRASLTDAPPPDYAEVIEA